MDSPTANAVDQLITDASVVVVVGPGGVGKTTMSAAVAARAAIAHGRSALVVTVDPARRLADALGIADAIEEIIEVDLGSPVIDDGDGPSHTGRLGAMMVDMAASWDHLVEQLSPNPKTKAQLLRNELYHTLTQRFVQSHDYIALDHIIDLLGAEEWDLIVIDTPPSVHGLDILDAPGRMEEFFGNRLLMWLTAPYRNSVIRLAAKPFLAVAERLLGGVFLAQIAEFFWLFSSMQPGLVRRARRVREIMAAPDTHYVITTTPEPVPMMQSLELAHELLQREFQPGLLVVNQSWLYRVVGDERPDWLRRAREQIDAVARWASSVASESPPVATAMHSVRDRLAREYDLIRAIPEAQPIAVQIVAMRLDPPEDPAGLAELFSPQALP